MVAFTLAMMSVAATPGAVGQEQSGPPERKVVNKVIPNYPELARRMQIVGTVRVEAVVAPNGKVKLTKVVGGSPVLAEAAVYAIEKWRWAPATDESKELIELRFHP